MTCPAHGDNECFACQHCGRCNSCKHQYVERADGWWKKCPTLKWWKVVSDNVKKAGF